MDYRRDEGIRDVAIFFFIVSREQTQSNRV